MDAAGLNVNPHTGSLDSGSMKGFVQRSSLEKLAHAKKRQSIEHQKKSFVRQHSKDEQEVKQILQRLQIEQCVFDVNTREHLQKDDKDGQRLYKGEVSSAIVEDTFINPYPVTIIPKFGETSQKRAVPRKASDPTHSRGRRSSAEAQRRWSESVDEPYSNVTGNKQTSPTRKSSSVSQHSESMPNVWEGDPEYISSVRRARKSTSEIHHQKLLKRALSDIFSIPGELTDTSQQPSLTRKDSQNDVAKLRDVVNSYHRGLNQPSKQRHSVSEFSFKSPDLESPVPIRDLLEKVDNQHCRLISVQRKHSNKGRKPRSVSDSGLFDTTSLMTHFNEVSFNDPFTTIDEPLDSDVPYTAIDEPLDSDVPYTAIDESTHSNVNVSTSAIESSANNAETRARKQGRSETFSASALQVDDPTKHERSNTDISSIRTSNDDVISTASKSPKRKHSLSQYQGERSNINTRVRRSSSFKETSLTKHDPRSNTAHVKKKSNKKKVSVNEDSNQCDGTVETHEHASGPSSINVTFVQGFP